MLWEKMLAKIPQKLHYANENDFLNQEIVPEGKKNK